MILMAQTNSDSIKMTSWETLAQKCFEPLLNWMDSRIINCLENFQIEICYFVQNTAMVLPWLKSD